MSIHVLLRCDGDTRQGVGHVVRCVALAEELLSRGHRVTLVGSVSGAPWLSRHLHSIGVAMMSAPTDAKALGILAMAVKADAVVLDGYGPPGDLGSALRSYEVVVLSIVDGSFGSGQDADIYVDQNLDASPNPVHENRVQLTGLRYALFRDSILASIRPLPGELTDHAGKGLVSTDVPETHRAPKPPRVLAFFGGTDAFSAAPTVVSLVIATGRSLEVAVVGATREIRSSLAQVHIAPTQSLSVIEPTPDLARRVASADVVVTAAGSSVWELLCLGVAAAVVCVTENQRVGYDALVARDLVAGLGTLECLRGDDASRRQAVKTLTEVVSEPAVRFQRTRRGRALVDGRGRSRVCDALEAAVRERQS